MYAPHCKIEFHKINLKPSKADYLRLIAIGISFAGMLFFNYDLQSFMMTGELPW